MAYSTTYATLTAELSTFVEDDTPEFVAALRAGCGFLHRALSGFSA